MRTTHGSPRPTPTTSSTSCESDGKQIEYLVFEDEGHDVTKAANKIRCYTAIADFMAEHLKP